MPAGFSSAAAIDFDDCLEHTVPVSDSERMQLIPVDRFHSAVLAVVILSLGLLGGCSWFFPRPDRVSNVIGDADTPRDGRCSLAVDQIRKSLPERIVAAGIPTPLIVHAPSSAATNRNLESGQPVYFEASTRNADSPPMSQPALWRIDGVDSTGAVAADGALLVTGMVVELRAPEATGYLRLDQATNAPTRSEASRIMLYKADVPDATRPTTCDEEIRDQDFVYLRAVDPNVWLTVGDTGILSARYTAPEGKPNPAADGNSQPRCPREEERCRTDPQGGLLCVWAPVCGN